MLGKFERKMHRAIKRGDLVTVAWAISVGADACACDKFGQSALHLAAREENLDIANYLLRYANPNSVDPLGMTPLMIAAENGNTDLVKLLCPRTDSSIKSCHGDTALTLALSRIHGPKGICMETVWPLLCRSTNKELDVNAKNPLVVAAEYGLTDVVLYFANPNDETCAYRRARRKAAKLAAETGNIECLGALLSPEDFDCSHLDKRDTWGWMLPRFANENYRQVFQTVKNYQFHLDEIAAISAAIAYPPDEQRDNEMTFSGEISQMNISSHSSEQSTCTVSVRIGRTRL